MLLIISLISLPGISVVVPNCLPSLYPHPLSCNFVVLLEAECTSPFKFGLTYVTYFGQ